MFYNSFFFDEKMFYNSQLRKETWKWKGKKNGDGESYFVDLDAQFVQ